MQLYQAKARILKAWHKADVLSVFARLPSSVIYSPLYYENTSNIINKYNNNGTKLYLEYTIHQIHKYC